MQGILSFWEIQKLNALELFQNRCGSVIIMNDQQLKRISKFLSLVLRHKPETINIQLDAQGWVDTQVLIDQCKANKRPLDLPTLQKVVADNNKKRFSFNEDGSKIRASQGHSVKIDLAYEAIEPPKILYHGTATRFVESIAESGLQKRNRHHVHLSSELATAKDVGSRHGKPVILEVKAKEMYDAGHEFFQSENGVWLTEEVLVQFIVFP